MQQSQPLAQLRTLNSIQSVKEIRRGSQIIVFSVNTKSHNELEEVYEVVHDTFTKSNITTPFLVIPDTIKVLRFQTKSLGQEIWQRILDILAWPIRKVHDIIRRAK